MEAGISYCEECNKKIKFNTFKKRVVEDLHGKVCEYEKITAICPECGGEVYAEEYEDINFEALKDAYRKKYNILTVAQLSELLDRYNIGKRPFSTVIGLGEITVTKLLEGHMPSNQSSELLRKIYDDPEFYKNRLIENKDLISKVAFEKSLNAVNNYVNEKNSESKLKLLAAYIIYQTEDITHLMLQKMLYYIQAFYFQYYKEYIFSEDCEAWVHGPVYREIYEKYKDYHYDSLKEETISKPELTTDEKYIADLVIKYFGCYSGRILEKFTHLEDPWQKARVGLQVNEISDRIIEKDSITEYFSRILGNDSSLFTDNIKNYASHLFTIVNENN